MDIQDYNDNPYIETAKYAFAIGGGVALAFTLVKHGADIAKKVLSVVSSKPSQISVEHSEVEVITPESAHNSDFDD